MPRADTRAAPSAGLRARLWQPAYRPLVVTLVALAVGYALSQTLSFYLVYLGTGAVIAAVLLLGLGVVTGTAGMISLCQLSFAAVGAWVVSWLAAHHVPGGMWVWVWVGGLAAALVGIVVGLPSLRLRGVNLAVVTLGFAAAADLTLRRAPFPGTLEGVTVPRPTPLLGDRGYFVFSMVVLAACTIGLTYLRRSRIGTGWRFIAFSERATASAGSSVPMAKMTSFAVGAFLAGISGGLLCGQIGVVYATSFTTIQSLAMYVLSVVTGSALIDMALIGGVVWVLVPELLKRLDVSQDWGFVVFGLLGVQSIASDANLGTGVREWLFHRRARATAVGTAPAPEAGEITGPQVAQRSAPRAAAASGDSAIFAVEDISMHFGAVHALDGVSFELQPHTTTALIGPNGAGKSTLVDVVAGFLHPQIGSVRLGGRDLRGLGPAQRARLGLRRTFQQDRIPLTMDVGTYVRYLSRGEATEAEVDRVLRHFDCPPRSTELRRVDGGTRRIVELAANLACRPSLLVLDEPAAGVSHDGHLRLADQLATAAMTFETTILLIEHDLDLVRATCPRVVVLDFGRVIADGPQAEVLSQPDVVAAYLGRLETTT